MDKAAQLLELKKDLESRKDIPLIHSPSDVVFGDGNPDADVMIIGEAAGYHESIEHKPFVGQSGKLLIATLTETTGLQRKDVYITNIIKARPPENRDPSPEEIEAFRPYLDKEIEIIKHRIIVNAGRFTMVKFIPGVTISRVHGIPHNCQLSIVNSQLKFIVFPMFHPAAALRGTGTMMQFKQDFVKLHSLLNPTSVVQTSQTETTPQSQQATLF